MANGALAELLPCELRPRSVVALPACKSIPADYPQTMYTYDADGNLKTVSEPNGMITTYSYGGLDRLTGEVVTETVGGISHEVFSESLTLYGDGSHKTETDTRYTDAGALDFQTKTSWTYDGQGELTEEVLEVIANPTGDAPSAYDDKFMYDGDGNRTEEDIYVSENGTATETGQNNYFYNADDQLFSEGDAYNNKTQGTSYSYTYDAEGNLSTEQVAPSNQVSSETTYTYDLQNHMTSVSAETNVDNAPSVVTTTTYGYDTSGVVTWERTQPSVGAGTAVATTYYLNDPNNPTGYTKAIELKTGITTADAMITRSYVLGLKVEAQASVGTDKNGHLIAVPVYFLTDGHGSTRSLVTQAGTQEEEYDYSAFGDLTRGEHYATAADGTVTPTAITQAQAETSWLFGGDGFYDPASGWTYHLARWTNGFWFTQSDFGGYGSTSDPLSLHKYLYANANPISGSDPSGHLDLIELGVVGTINLIAFTVLTSPIITAAISATALVGTVAFITDSKFRDDILEVTGGDLTQVGGLFAAGIEGGSEIASTLFGEVRGELSTLTTSAPALVPTAPSLPSLSDSAASAFRSASVKGESQALIGWITPEGNVGFAEATPTLGGHKEALAAGILPQGSRGFSILTNKEGQLLLFNPNSGINPAGAFAITSEEEAAVMKALPEKGPNFKYVKPVQ